MYLYTNCVTESYAGGMIVVAAPNAFRAMEIIKAHDEHYYLDENLEQIVGATYDGKEGIIREETYFE